MPLNQSALLIQRERAFFGRHAERLTWYRGVWCSCASTVDGFGNPYPYPTADHADPTCTVCSGLGWYVVGPGQMLLGIVSKVQPDKDLIPQGFDESATMVLTQAPDTAPRVADLDLVVPTWPLGETYMGQLVVRGTGVSDDLLYPPQVMEAVLQSDSATGTVTQYQEAADFTISGSAITWITGGSSPTSGSVYTVKYAPQFQFVCFIPPMPRYERGTDLGQRVLMYKRHMIYPKGPNVVTPA